MSVVEDVRKVLQDFLAPELRAVHASFKAVDVRLDAIEEKIDARFDSVNIRFAAAEEKNETRFEAVRNRFTALEDIATVRHNEILTRIDFLKSSLDLDKRVERLESRQPQQPS
jgi:hypothetical protein